MTIPATNRSLFNQPRVKILERGLHSMTLACEAMTKENKDLRDKADSLSHEVSRLRDKILVNQ